MGRLFLAPKASALPGCATPRRAEALRFRARKGQVQSYVHGICRKNMARTGETTPGIVPEDVRPAFYINRPATGRQSSAGLSMNESDLRYACSTNYPTGFWGASIRSRVTKKAT